MTDEGFSVNTTIGLRVHKQFIKSLTLPEGVSEGCGSTTKISVHLNEQFIGSRLNNS